MGKKWIILKPKNVYIFKMTNLTISSRQTSIWNPKKKEMKWIGWHFIVSFLWFSLEHFHLFFPVRQKGKNHSSNGIFALEYSTSGSSQWFYNSLVRHIEGTFGHLHFIDGILRGDRYWHDKCHTELMAATHRGTENEGFLPPPFYFFSLLKAYW